MLVTGACVRCAHAAHGREGRPPWAAAPAGTEANHGIWRVHGTAAPAALRRVCAVWPGAPRMACRVRGGHRPGGSRARACAPAEARAACGFGGDAVASGQRGRAHDLLAHLHEGVVAAALLQLCRVPVPGVLHKAEPRLPGAAAHAGPHGRHGCNALSRLAVVPALHVARGLRVHGACADLLRFLVCRGRGSRPLLPCGREGEPGVRRGLRALLQVAQRAPGLELRLRERPGVRHAPGVVVRRAGRPLYLLPYALCFLVAALALNLWASSWSAAARGRGGGRCEKGAQRTGLALPHRGGGHPCA